MSLLVAVIGGAGIIYGIWAWAILRKCRRDAEKRARRTRQWQAVLGDGPAEPGRAA